MCIEWCTIAGMKSATLRTNSELDLDLLTAAARLTGIRTKRLLVREGLQALVDAKCRRSLLPLRGKIKFDRGYDYRAARERGR